MRHATTHAPSQTKAALWISFFLGLWVNLWSLDAAALPLYATREGRTCDNCHINPNGWTNPDLSDRKCNLSCSGCHVDPLGGGLRTVSGRFYGESTLPMFLPSHRGWKDWGRNLFDFGPEERKNRAPDLAWGTPIGGSAPWALDQGRYAGLNADPLVSVGLDARMAAWSGGEGAVSVFPMQLDTHLALHPVRHLTLFGTGGVLSKSKGVGATFERETVYAPKDVSLMVHQLPYQAYARVGRFIPPFGTRLDDHTSLIRRELELDGASLHSRVTGAELGLAPNYPYLNAAVFRPNQKEILSGADPNNELDPSFWGVDGLGAALSAGWRDLGWSLGGSAMLRRRALEDGGDTDTLGLQGSFNPWFYSDSVPLTFMAEYDIGWRQRELSGKTAQHTAAYAELDWLPYNGLNLRLKYDFADPDAEVKEDHLHRVGFGFDLNIIPNVVWTTQARLGIPAVGEGELQPDFILILRGWL
jgi:hypothetical protein